MVRDLRSSSQLRTECRPKSTLWSSGLRGPEYPNTSQQSSLGTSGVDEVRLKYDSHRTKGQDTGWCSDGVCWSQLNMAALVGCGQRSIIHTRKNEARSTRNEFQDFHRSFRAQQLDRASPRPPRRPQPSATSCRPTSSGREPFSSCMIAPQLARSQVTMTLYGKDAGLSDRRTFTSSVGKFCDVYKWHSSDKARRQIHVAPDVLYRYTYGTTDWHRSDVISDVEMPNRKPSAQAIIDDIRDQEPTGWDAIRHLEYLTKPTIEVKCNPVSLEPTRKRQQTPAIRFGNPMNTPRKLGGTPRSNSNHLYGKVRTSIELFHQSSEPGNSPRMAPTGYHRERTKRGKSVAMLDYLQDSGWSTLRRSQTAPMAMESVELSSADAYLQYVEQQRTGKGSRRQLPSRKTVKDAPVSRTPTASLRAPPVTPRSWDSEMRNIRSNSGTTAATPALWPPTRSGDISSARGASVSADARTEARSATVATNRGRRKDVTGSESLNEKGKSATSSHHSDTRRMLDDVTAQESEAGDSTRNSLSGSKREKLTVDLRSAVGDATGEL